MKIKKPLTIIGDGFWIHIDKSIIESYDLKEGSFVELDLKPCDKPKNYVKRSWRKKVK